MHRSIVLLVLLFLLVPAAATSFPPWPQEETTEPVWLAPELRYAGPNGCDAPPLFPFLLRPAGTPKVHDADGDGVRDPGETIVLSQSETARDGDLVLSSADAGRLIQANDFPLTDLGVAWTFLDWDGDGVYSRGDVVFLDATPTESPRVDVGDVEVSSQYGGHQNGPVDVDAGHHLLHNALLPLHPSLAVRDLGGDGTWDWDDEVRLLHGDQARFGDVLLTPTRFGRVVEDPQRVELPLTLEMDRSLRRSPGGTLYLSAHDDVRALDVRLQAGYAALVRVSDGDHGTTTEPVPGHLAFLRDPDAADNGALYWDLDGDGALSQGDVALRSGQPHAGDGRALVRLDAPLRALDRDWDGMLGLGDDVVLDVDGNGRFTAHDHVVVGDVSLNLWSLGYPAALRFQPTCLETGYVPGQDTDGDGLPDRHDADLDGDGHAWTVDNCWYTPNPDQANLDGDRFGDACDLDKDGDGAYVDEDFDDRDPQRRDGIDSDGDGTDDVLDDDADGDGTPDGMDNCPSLANDQSDLDGDNNGDACDGDPDGDGYFYDRDAYPMDPDRFRRGEEHAEEPDGNATAGELENGTYGGVDVPAAPTALLLAGLGVLAALRSRRTR